MWNKILKYTAAITLMVWFERTLNLYGLRTFSLEFNIISIPASFGFLWIVDKLDKIK